MEPCCIGYPSERVKEWLLRLSPTARRPIQRFGSRTVKRRGHPKLAFSNRQTHLPRRSLPFFFFPGRPISRPDPALPPLLLLPRPSLSRPDPELPPALSEARARRSSRSAGKELALAAGRAAPGRARARGRQSRAGRSSRPAELAARQSSRSAELAPGGAAPAARSSARADGGPRPWRARPRPRRGRTADLGAGGRQTSAPASSTSARSAPARARADLGPGELGHGAGAADLGPGSGRGGGPRLCGGDAKARREDASLGTVYRRTQNAYCFWLLRWRAIFPGKNTVHDLK